MEGSTNYYGMTSNSVADELRKLTYDERTIRMKQKNYRLASFGEHWPHHGQLSKQRMAEAGLYYNGPGDKVTCPYCKVFIECWGPHDDPMTEHRNLSHTGCPFINQHDAGGHNSIGESMDTAGPWQNVVHAVAAPLDPSLDAAPPESSPRYTRTEAGWRRTQPKQPVAQELQEPRRRLQSYSRWPKDHHKTPDELFPAGFYYTGVADKVRCYSCGVELNRWEPNDIPWVEHARFSPTCEFLRAKKTEFFIDQVYMDENGGHERIKNIKQDLRDYARSRGISESDISQVLLRSEPYESEDDMYSAILALERDRSTCKTAVQADDTDEGKYTLYGPSIYMY